MFCFSAYQLINKVLLLIDERNYIVLFKISIENVK